MPSRQQIITDMTSINRSLSSYLWNMVHTQQAPSGLSPRLVFPSCRSKEEHRVSEQEARFLYTSILNTTNYFYSVETPTTNGYCQTGTKNTSARTDLSLYLHRGKQLQKVANVELKAHNCQEELITKDFDKIRTEGIPANWFHTMRSIDSGSLGKLFAKMQHALLNPGSGHDAIDLNILFCFCVIDQQWACLKPFRYTAARKTPCPRYVEQFFRLDYHIHRGQIVVDNRHEWELFPPQEARDTTP